MSFFNSLVQRVGYGAIMYNVSTGTTLSSCYPFFTSQSDLSKLKSTSSSGAGTISINDVDEYWTVMPGYKLEVYNNVSYVSPLLTGNNTTGIVPVNYTIGANQASSIKLYFNNTLIEQPGDTVALFNGSAVTVSNYATTYDISYGSTYYHVYEFYTGSTGTISVPAGKSDVSMQCLLIGGGGGGGNYNTGSNGSGGGGAGTFITTSFNATPGATFTVTVGAGGAGGGANSNNAGSAGSPSSITRTVNGVIDASLNVSGGGSGGSVNATTGSIGTIYGSTGGTCNAAPRTAGTTLNTAYTVTTGSTLFNGITVSAFRGGQGVASGGGGGGGGAGTVGTNGIASNNGGNGGAGKVWAINGTTYAGGGAGMNAIGYTAPGGVGGSGGGGNSYVSATANTGSGGGAGYAGSVGGSGGSGICIIAVPV